MDRLLSTQVPKAVCGTPQGLLSQQGGTSHPEKLQLSSVVVIMNVENSPSQFTSSKAALEECYVSLGVFHI